MAEFNTDLTVKPTQTSSLADMLNMAKGVQAYQQAQQINPLTLRQQQLATQQAEETTPLTIEQQKQATKQAQLTTQKEQLSVTKGYQDIINQSLNALSLDPDIQEGKDAKAIVKKIAKQRDLAIRKGVPLEDAEIASSALMNEAYKNPASVIDHLGNIRRSMMTPSEVQAGVGGQETVQGTDISGNPTITRLNPNTGRMEQVPLPVGNQTVENTNMRIAPGESPATIATMQEERNVAQNQAKTAASALANIQAVRKYLPLAQTGKGSEAIKGLQSVFGNLAGSTPEEKAASARDIVEKSIEDLASQKNLALGGKFQADLQAAQKSIASAEKNPTAILKSMQMLEPLIQHSINYSQGLQNAITKNGGNIQIKRKYDQEMIDAFDPQALNIYNAYKNKDMKDFNELTKGLSDTKKREVFNKMQKYNSLIQGNL